MIEVGPGTGVLTQFILEKEKKNFLALDVDAQSIDFLRLNFPDAQAHFLLEDFLETNVNVYCQGKWDVIGNFPYNISSQIMFRILENRDNVDVVVGMFQKEVAARICSPPGTKEYGILSVLIQAFYSTAYLFTVQPGSFNPPPKVKSGVIRLIRNEHKHLNCNEDLFFRVVKTAFNQRRKTLRNALRPLLGVHELNNEYMEKRAERLTVSDFVFLTNEIEKIK